MKRGGPLRRVTPLRRTAMKRHPSKAGDFSEQTRRLVALRSKGICEFPECTTQASHCHHRRPRRCGDHSVDNAMHVCAYHHHFIHAHPAVSYEMGWLIRVN